MSHEDVVTFFGTDEMGTIRKGNVARKDVTIFVLDKFDGDWCTLDVVDHAGVHIGGIVERFRTSSSIPVSRTWFSEEEEKCNRCKDGRADFGDGPRACVYCLGTMKVTKGSPTNVTFGPREEGTGTSGE